MTCHSKLSHSDRIEFGPYKGRMLRTVPAEYLLKLDETGLLSEPGATLICGGRVHVLVPLHDYIEQNREQLVQDLFDRELDYCDE